MLRSLWNEAFAALRLSDSGYYDETSALQRSNAVLGFDTPRRLLYAHPTSAMASSCDHARLLVSFRRSMVAWRVH